MMDTGADPSVVDRGIVQKMNIPYSTKYSQVYGLGQTALAVCGTACVAIDVGDGRPLEHEIEVLHTNNRVVILGRRFLARFKNTTFDWENMRVRLGGCWKTSLAAARGGYTATRAEIMQTEMGKEGDSLEARFDINPKLSPREETAICKVLSRWKDVFAENLKSPREIGTAEHVITLLDERPTRSRPLRVSPEIEAEVSKQIDEMLENGIIRPSSSSWASRVILVKKKNGTHRFAVDYRDLNDVTKRDAYPMPDPRDVFDRMGGATIFSTLDGASAYWSVPVKEKHMEFTAFVSTHGQFEFNRMPFGLSNSQTTYQQDVHAFVDDTCVHSPSFDTHLEHLDEAQLAILKIEN